MQLKRASEEFKALEEESISILAQLSDLCERRIYVRSTSSKIVISTFQEYDDKFDDWVFTTSEALLVQLRSTVSTMSAVRRRAMEADCFSRIALDLHDEYLRKLDLLATIPPISELSPQSAKSFVDKLSKEWKCGVWSN